MDLTIKDNLAIINLGSDENRIHIKFIQDFNRHLDTIETNDDIGCLICTGSGKFFSNGVDIDNMMIASVDDQMLFWTEFHCLLVRILCFPMPTIAAINGHAFAGGCLLSLAFDCRVMNSAKGWLSLNEVYMPSRFPEFLMHYLKDVLPAGYARIQLVALGKRFTAADALQAGFIQAAVPAAALMDKVCEIAQETLKLGSLSRDGCQNLKIDLHKDLIPQVDKVPFMDQPEVPKSKL